jgi:hypothetical protein
MYSGLIVIMVYGCSSDENVIPESTDDAAGTESPGTLSVTVGPKGNSDSCRRISF